MQNLDPARILSPFHMKMKGIMQTRQLRPPSREHAPEIPRRRNMGVHANGRTQPRTDRVHEAAALADAAKISYASVM